MQNERFSQSEVVPGAGSLVEQIDKRIFVWLRDRRMYVGMLRSVDQFANLLLSQAYERIHVDKFFADLPQGAIIVRGENVALLGEMDGDDDEGKKISPDALLAVKVAIEQKKEKFDKLKLEAYRKRGWVLTPEDYF